MISSISTFSTVAPKSMCRLKTSPSKLKFGNSNSSPSLHTARPPRPLAHSNLHRTSFTTFASFRDHEPFTSTSSLTSSTLASIEDATNPVNFYRVLNVSPSASQPEIKAAYLTLMKIAHPDVHAAASSDYDEGTLNELCHLITEAYKCLSDPENRQIYDEVTGYGDGALSGPSPFFDQRYPADQLFVDEPSCIGCRLCVEVMPSTFVMEEEFGRAKVKDSAQLPPAGAATETLDEVIEKICPTKCIHRVSRPQLVLLCEEMAYLLTRPSVSKLRTNPSASAFGPDIFTRAEVRWEKRRQAALGRAAEREEDSKMRSSGLGGAGGISDLWSTFTSSVASPRYDPQAEAARAAQDEESTSARRSVSASANRQAGSTEVQLATKKKVRALRRLAKKHKRKSGKKGVSGILPPSSPSEQ